MIKRINLQKGQSLIEVIVAMAVFAVISGAIMSVTLGSLNGLTQGGDETQARAFASEGIEALHSIRDNAWNNLIYSPAQVSVVGAKWTLLNNSSELINNKYTRTITLANICRDGSDNIATCPAIYADPHTKLATISVSWSPRAGATNTVTQNSYLTNWDSRDWTQTDWSGGGGQSTWSNATRYNSDDGNVDMTATGEIKLKLNGGGIDGNTMGMWHLDEASGNIIDYSGNGNDLGNVKGSPSYNQSGKFATSLQFSGNSSRYINNGQQHGLDFTTVFTLDAWIYRTSSAVSSEAIISKWRETGKKQSYALIANSSNKLELRVSSTGSNSTSVTAVNTIPLNQWVHVAGVYDGSKIYVFQNGILENSLSYSSNINTSSAYVAVSGADVLDGGNSYFNGKIDEARASNVARWTSTFTPPTSAYSLPGYAPFGILTSSAFNMSNVSPVQIVEWDETKPANTNIQLQIRTAPDSGGVPGTWTSWYGASGAGSYFTVAKGALVPLDLNGNQWVQYQVELSGDGSVTPTLSEIRVNYK